MWGWKRRSSFRIRLFTCIMCKHTVNAPSPVSQAKCLREALVGPHSCSELQKTVFEKACCDQIPWVSPHPDAKRPPMMRWDVEGSLRPLILSVSLRGPRARL